MKKISLLYKRFLLKLDYYRIIHLSDKKFLEFYYEKKFNKKLNLNNPQTFNEKLQWLKLNDRRDIYTTMVDKYEVKKYIANIIGEEYIIPTLGIYNSFDEIDFNKLPNQFVIKCTHDSGGLVIVKDKNKMNKEEARKKINRCLKNNFYYNFREWPYKNVKPRIIIEKYIEDKENNDLLDYKFMCFNGMPKYVYVTVKNDNIFENYYDLSFKKININHGYPRLKSEFKKPQKLDCMIKICKILSKDIPFVRIDFHYVDGIILFGEITFYDWAGLKPFNNIEDDYKLGKMIKLK